MAEPPPPLPAALVSLLVSLESVSPSLAALPPPAASWGRYFLDGDSDASADSRRELRLRIMSAIANCRSLKTINFNPLTKSGLYRVREVEALALLNGLKRNPALESLILCWIKGFGTTEACAALADAVLRHSRSLGTLDLRGLELSVEGLGHIAAALRDNSGSVLRVMYLDKNEIGDAARARHVAGILSHSRALEVLGMFGIGLDGAGAVVIADAVARNSTLDRIDIGYDLQKDPGQAAMLVPVLKALSCDVASSGEQSHGPSAAAPCNQSITRLWLEVTGLAVGEGMAGVAELAEALNAMLRSNTSLKFLKVTSFFVTRGLSGLAHSSNITTLLLVHHHSVEAEELDPFVMEIVQECTKLQVLQLRFMKPYGASKFTKVFFQGLKHNPCVKRLVLDGWDGLDDEMFEDLIRSLSTNTNLEHISIKGTSWEKQGKGERLAKTLKDARVKQLPSPLLALLGDLESDSPALQQLPSVDLWGRYFNCECEDGECHHRGEWQWDVRLRFLTAIGKCRSLRKIQLNPLWTSGCRRVRQVEALALLSGLRDNIVLQELNLFGYVGFGEPAVCEQALTAVIEKSFRSLDFLGLQYVGLSVDGLGYIAAALRRNGSSVMSKLSLCGNDIGDAVGAQHLADILSNLTTLRNLWISNIGMDEEGAVLIAAALAHSTTMTSLRIGDYVPRNPNKAVPTFVIPLLEALVWNTPDQEKQEASNHSITLLVLECPGGQQVAEPGLGEALARVLRSNRALEDLRLASFFVTRGLEALRENSSITKLQVFHMRHSEDDDMDPMLITILEECKSVQELQLKFGKPFGPSKFTKALFRGLHNNRSIKTLVLDDWDGLDDYMFQDLMRSLRPNCNNVLENISIKKTSWESEGKGIHIQNALTRNIRRRSAGQQGSEPVPAPVMASMATSSGDAVPVSEELLGLLAELESPSPTLSRLPRGDAYRQLFKKDVEHSKAERELRLRLMTAIGKCPTLRSIDLDPLARRNCKVTVAEATAFLKGLSSNAVVERLDLSGYHGFGTGAACNALAATLRSSRTLQFLNMGYTGMTADGLGCIAAALRENRNSVLRSLYLSGNTTLGESARSLYLCGDTIVEGAGADHLAGILSCTPALRSLEIWNIGLDEAGALKIGSALAQNTTLDWLNIGFDRGRPKQAGIMAMLLARALTPGVRDVEQEAESVAPKPPSANESVTQLRLEIWGSGQEPINASLGEAVARMLRTNTTLKHFDLSSCFISRGLEGLCDNSSIIRVTVRQNTSSHNDDYSKLMPILQRCQSVESLHLVQNSVVSSNLSKMFFRSLQTNRYLKKLVLDDWKGLDDDMFQELMQSLQVNTNLESMSFENTAWKRQGKGAAVDEVLRQNREYRRALAGVPTMPVKSCRLVLCGFPYAGKTTIRNTLMEMETHEDYAEMEGETISEEIPRTLGFEVKVIKDAPALRITVWDLAGHREYHALHDFVFPNVNNSSLFLFVYNPFKVGGKFSSMELKDRKDFREEFVYWLKFIASNSQLGQQVKPYVHVVVTFGDKLQGDKHSVAICEEMLSVKKKFMNLVETSYEPTFINGQSWKHVYALRVSTEQKLRQLVSKLAPVPNICEQTRIHVQRWVEDQQGTPIIYIDKFSELFHNTCNVALEHPLISEDYRRFLLDFMVKEDSWKAVASYLKDSGEIIYFEISGLMVLNLQWLGMGVFGQLIGIFGEPDEGRDWLQVQNGFISKYGLSMLLKMSLNKVGLVETIVSEEQFIQLLLELHLCYESRDGEGQVRYFIPICTYGEGDIAGVDQQLEWPSQDGDPNDYIFIGLRLQCDDQDCTFLTPGFFPRLQVLLYSYCLEKGWVDEDVRPIDSAIKLQPNVLLISVEFLDIFVEFNAEVGCYIDILARSTEGYLRSLSFLQEHIVSQIRSFCASYEGCAGVTLVEGVLRRECVVSLTLCRYRKHQCILTDKLIKEVAATKEKGYAHYTQSWRAISTSTQGQPPILKANKEYATVVDGHIILGQKGDLARAEAESEGSKSKNSSFSGGTPTQLSPQEKAVQRVQHIAGSYPNHSVEAGRRRGLAVIVSMEEDRPGGAVDRGRLEALLKTLAFDTDIVVNQSENVKAYLRRLAKLPTLANDDCFLCCINAHGGIDEDGRQFIFISGAGGQKLYVDDDILKPISESRFLANKPKVFVINACRGSGSLITGKKAEDEVDKTQMVSNRAGEVRALHSVSDCLIVFSTSHGQQSFRDAEKGTNFITALMDAIVQGSQMADVLSILTSVIGKVTEMEVKLPSQAGKRPEKKFQCPELYTTLTRGLYWSSP